MSDNPYESSKTASETSSAGRSLQARALGWLISLAIIGLLVALMLPAKRGVREAARRNVCLNNTKQIALALLNYEKDHGTLPPAYTVDEEGNRLHSWRTLILPYLEEAALFESIDLTKAWDDPVNSHARDAVLDFYTCPSADHELGLTTYLAVAGPDCVFFGSTPRTLAEVADDGSQTLLFIEVSPNQAVHWMSPEDIRVEELLDRETDFKTNHPGVFHVAFLDGRARAVQLTIDREALRAMTTIGGGASLDE